MKSHLSARERDIQCLACQRKYDVFSDCNIPVGSGIFAVVVCVCGKQMRIRIEKAIPDRFLSRFTVHFLGED